MVLNIIVLSKLLVGGSTMVKKIIKILVTSVVALSLFTGCQKNNSNIDETKVSASPAVWERSESETKHTM